MHSHVNECAERRNVGDSSFQDHAGCEVGDFLHAFFEAGGFEFWAGVTSGFIQLGDDVGDGGDAESFISEISGLQFGEHRRVSDQSRDIQSCGFRNVANNWVRLGVNSGGVERVGGSRNAEEASTLFKGFGSQARNFVQFFSGGESTVFVAVGHDIVCQGGGHSGNSGKKWCGCGVEVNSDCVYCVFDDTIKGFGKCNLVDIVLVLADSDGFGLNLDELRQWILESPRDRNCTAEGDVHVGEFFGCDR